jgi:hypothetical protein
MFSTPFRVRFSLSLNFFDIFSKNPQTWNFIKIRPVGAELFREDILTDGRTDGETDGRKDGQKD